MFTSPSLTLTSGHAPPPVLKIEPGDTIIVQSPHRMSRSQMEPIRDGIKKLFPDHRLIILAEGITLNVARQTGIETSPDHSQSDPGSSYPSDGGSSYPSESSYSGSASDAPT